MNLLRWEIEGTPRLRDQILRLHPRCEVAPGADGDPRDHLERLLVRNPVLASLRRLVPRPGRVLVAGTGTGEIAAALASRGRDVETVVADDDEGRLRLARGWAEALGLREVVTVPSPWPEVEVQGRFDLILVPHLLQELRQPWFLLGRLREHLVPGGWIVAGLRSPWGSWQGRLETSIVLLLAGRNIHEREELLEKIAAAAALREPAATAALVASRLRASRGGETSVTWTARRMREVGLQWAGSIPALHPLAASLAVDHLHRGPASRGRLLERGLGIARWFGEALWVVRLRPWGSYLAIARRPGSHGPPERPAAPGRRARPSPAAPPLPTLPEEDVLEPDVWAPGAAGRDDAGAMGPGRKGGEEKEGRGDAREI